MVEKKFNGVCYKITFPDGCFYIGSTKNWRENYYGSGGRRLKEHLEMFGKGNAKREIIKSDFDNDLEMRTYEDELINNYFYVDENGVKHRTEDGEKLLNYCSGNISKSSYKSVANNICELCGGMAGHHMNYCERYSKNPITVRCEYCGSIGFHKKDCPKYKQLGNGTCSECGKENYHHYKWCSKYKERTNQPKSRIICGECGGKNGHHRKICSKYKEPNLKNEECSECGATGNNHFGWCSKNKIKDCPECGGKNGRHRKGCSNYKMVICEECGGENNNHKATCSKCKICDECNGVNGHHRKCCSKFKYNKKNE